MAKPLEIWGTRDPNTSAQLALAARLDLFKQEAGLDVLCKFLESGTTMPAEILKAKEKPFAFTQTPLTAILLHDKDFSTKVVAPLADIAGTQQVIVHPASGIVYPQDLEGKRIGMCKDAAIYMAFKNMAQDCHVDVARITFVDLLPHDQLAGFQAGTLDAMACWEPWTTKARNMGGRMYFSGARSEIPGNEGDVNWLIDQGCLIVPDRHLIEYPAETAAILKVLRKATDLINEHRKEIAQELAGFFEVTPPELIAAMRKNLYAMVFDNLCRIGILGFRDFLYEDGQVSNMFAEQELYETKWLRKVDPALILIEDTVAQDVAVVEKPGIYYRKDVMLVGDPLDLRFLVVDDSRVVRAALAQTIEILGGEVLGEATDGQEAIDLFPRLRPNFVTMDLSMPGVSGVDAIKHILHLAPETNIIVISATNLKEVREEVFDLGVKIFIVKPFDPLHVAEIIGLLLL